MELCEQMRREYEHGAGTIRAVARRLGVHRREVRRALTSAVCLQSGRSRNESGRSWRQHCRLSTRFWKLIARLRVSSGTRRVASGRGYGRRCRRSGSASPRCASMCGSARRRWDCWDRGSFRSPVLPVWRRSTGGRVRDLCGDRRPAAQSLHLLHALDGLGRSLCRIASCGDTSGGGGSLLVSSAPPCLSRPVATYRSTSCTNSSLTFALRQPMSVLTFSGFYSRFAAISAIIGSNCFLSFLSCVTSASTITCNTQPTAIYTL